jgi:hypothetical protein
MYQIIESWKDSLMWCPSQCYLNIKFKDKYYVIYLRWRHANPWTGNLISTDKTFNLSNKVAKWVYNLDLFFHRDCDLIACKEDAENCVKQIFLKDVVKADMLNRRIS